MPGAKVGYFQANVTNSAAAIKSGLASQGRTPGGCVVRASPSNAGNIFIGGDASVTSGTGYKLAPGDAVSIPVDDPARIFAIADVAGPLVLMVLSVGG